MRRGVSWSSKNTAQLEHVWKEATVRVARQDELERVVGLMRQYESVHEGEEGSGPRSWQQRVIGTHRFTALLEHGSSTLAYILVAVSAGPAAAMQQVFGDSWPHSAVRDTCNFYSINAVNKPPDHPFAGVPVGFPLIRKTGELLLVRGVRSLLHERALAAPKDDEEDVAAESGRAKLYTMSPVPSLASALESSNPRLFAMLRNDPAAVDAAKEELLALAQTLVAERKDPVAKFHLGNGAVLHRLNWRADDSPLRMRQSFGLMCNYDYNSRT